MGVTRVRHVQDNQTVQLEHDDVCIAAVSDTHGRPHRDLGRQLREQHPALILHCGDIGGGEVLDALAGVAPLIAVRGNVDGRELGLPDSVDLALQRPTQPRLRLLLTHIAVYRLHLTQTVRNRAQAADAQLVVFGHSHTPFVGQQGRFSLFNPGAAGPRRFRLPVTFGVLRLNAGGLHLHHIDLETGNTWTP